jgi:hypothetical protein
MKQSLFFKSSAIIIVGIFFYSCQKATLPDLTASATQTLMVEKQDQQLPFKADFNTFYRFNPIAPIPVVVNGVTYVGFAYVPGGGTGNATHMGNCKTYFNQLSYTNAPGGLPLGSVSAAVTDILSYPITGAPLPLIQAGDFNGLVMANNWYHFPATVQGKIINSVIYDDRGNAVFTSFISNETFPISETVIGFRGKGVVLGGRGKFNDSKGEFDFNGQFNITNPNEAEYHFEGWICY